MVGSLFEGFDAGGQFAIAPAGGFAQCGHVAG
jgi:hypothetical protein